MNTPNPPPGRGTGFNPANRFERILVSPDEDFAEFDEQGVPIERPHPQTHFYFDASESLLTHNTSPDVGAGWGLNCYRGCEHVIFRLGKVFTKQVGSGQLSKEMGGGAGGGAQPLPRPELALALPVRNRSCGVHCP